MESEEDYNQERIFLKKMLLILVMMIPSLIITLKALLFHLSIPHRMIWMLIRYQFWRIDEQNFISYDRQEKNDIQDFIDMFKDKHSYPNTNSITDSKIYHGKWTKIYSVYDNYLYIENFMKIKENQDHRLKNKVKISLIFLRKNLNQI